MSNYYKPHPAQHDKIIDFFSAKNNLKHLKLILIFKNVEKNKKFFKI